MITRILLFITLLLPVSTHSQEFHPCILVIDGDTIAIELNGQTERVRLIGINTPERGKSPQFFAEEAYAFTKSMAEGKKVRLEYDAESRDEYERLLAYVYLEDGTFLNAEIIKQGYSPAFTKYPFRFMDDFKTYQKEAERDHRGMWRKGSLMLPPKKKK
jgi:micrococcal nuclease